MNCIKTPPRVVWLIAGLALLFIAIDKYHNYLQQELLHKLHVAMLEIANKEHFYYLDNYFYAQNIIDLNLSIVDLVGTDFPYSLSIKNTIDKYHDFVIVVF